MKNGMRQRVCFLVLSSLLAAALSAYDNAPYAEAMERPGSAQASEPLTMEELAARFGQTAGTLQGAFQQTDPNASYRALSITLDVGRKDSPKIVFYCRVSGEGEDWEIQSIEAVLVDQQDGDLERAFGGNLTAWLRPPRGIEYVINGDFFRNGTVDTISHEITEDGTCANVLYQSTFADQAHHYQYVYLHHTTVF